MKGLVVTPNYPDKKNPGRGAFVAQLANELENEGVDVSILAPKSIANLARDNGKKDDINFQDIMSVERPLFPTFSSRKILGFNLARFSDKGFVKAVLKSKISKLTFDFYYGKFLLKGGAAAVELGKLNKKPSFIDLGESKLLEVLDEDAKKIARSILELASGIICVSERLRQEAILLGADPGKVIVIPNRADPAIFRPMDQALCREELNLNRDVKLVAFVGYFINRKGIHYVEKSIRELNEAGHNIQGIFIGSGPLEPSDDICTFKGTLAHSELPIWLNAADVFCLPTVAEGNCNAINEAMAIGLPIVSSNIPDVVYQLENYHRSVLVDPRSLESIKNGIVSSLNNIDYFGDRETHFSEYPSRGEEISRYIGNFFNSFERKCII